MRTTYDAEPTYHPCTVASRDEHVVWWEGSLPVHNPVTNYRFLLDGAGGQRWLTARRRRRARPAGRVRLPAQLPPGAAGLGPRRRRLPGLPRPVRPLGGGRRRARSRTGRCRRSGTTTVVFEGFDPRTPMQFFGGDLDGITEHLDHLADIGVSVVYTTPVFPGESNHRYNASTFEDGRPAARRRRGLRPAGHRRARPRLADPRRPDHQPHRRHHEWFVAARDVEGAPARSFYYFLPERRLRVLDGPRHAAEAQPRRPRAARGDGRRPGLGRGALAAAAVRPRRLAGRRRQHDRPPRRDRRQPRGRPAGTRAPRRPSAPTRS